jgi:hypothetical protein
MRAAPAIRWLCSLKGAILEFVIVGVCSKFVVFSDKAGDGLMQAMA